MISLVEAYKEERPFLGFGSSELTGVRRRLFGLVPPKLKCKAQLKVFNADLWFAPDANNGRKGEDFWADTDAAKWPGLTPRQTSHYLWTIAPTDYLRPILFRTADGTQGLLRVTGANFNEILLERRLLPPAPAPRSQPATPRTFSVTMSDGTYVEILGLCHHPLSGQAWWKPDGSPLARAPYLIDPKVRLMTLNDDRKTIEMAFITIAPQKVVKTVTGNRTTVTLSQGSVTRFGVEGNSGAGSHSIVDEFGNRSMVPFNTGEMYVFDKDRMTTSVRFGFACEPWTMVLSSSAGSQSTQGAGGLVSFGPLNWENGRPAVDVILSNGWGNFAVRVVALDSAGKSYNLDFNQIKAVEPSSLEQTRYHYTVSSDLRQNWPADIAELRLEATGFTDLVFENVSLEAGQITDVKTRQEPPPPVALPASQPSKGALIINPAMRKRAEKNQAATKA
jgi:hypothetical protein